MERKKIIIVPYRRVLLGEKGEGDRCHQTFRVRLSGRRVRKSHAQSPPAVPAASAPGARPCDSDVELPNVLLCGGALTPSKEFLTSM